LPPPPNPILTSLKLVTSISISQHKHVYTIGKRPNEHNILATEHELRACGAEVHKTRRGGDVTYHGPGQFVLYPVINLRDAKVGARGTWRAWRT
jgi:lipoyl(octanoyl) transferase